MELLETFSTEQFFLFLLKALIEGKTVSLYRKSFQGAATGEWTQTLVVRAPFILPPFGTLSLSFRQATPLLK